MLASTGHGARPRLDRLSSNRGWRAHRIPLGSRRGCAVPRKLAPRVGRRINTRHAGGKPARPSSPSPAEPHAPKAQKGAESFASSLSSLLFHARVSRSRPRRGEAAASSASLTSPMPASSLRATCVSRALIPCSLLRPLASCSPGMVAPAASLSSCPSCRRLSFAEAPLDKLARAMEGFRGTCCAGLGRETSCHRSRGRGSCASRWRRSSSASGCRSAAGSG